MGFWLKKEHGDHTQNFKWSHNVGQKLSKGRSWQWNSQRTPDQLVFQLKFNRIAQKQLKFNRMVEVQPNIIGQKKDEEVDTDKQKTRCNPFNSRFPTESSLHHSTPLSRHRLESLLPSHRITLPITAGGPLTLTYPNCPGYSTNPMLSDIYICI